MRTDPLILSGVEGPVEIQRDHAGVPRITAIALPDTCFGLGYCHARDRGLQILLWRILGRGRASECLRASKDFLHLDRFFRSLNLLGDLAAQESALTLSARTALEAYCSGINLYFTHARVPWELRLFGYQIRGDPWTVADVFLIGKVLGYVSLAQAQAEMERFVIECVQRGLPRPQLEELFPGQLGGLDEALLRRVRIPSAFVPAAIKWPTALPRGMSSNAWALAGAKTASGKPLLCNDPHLEINRIPPIFYEATLCWGGAPNPQCVLGATIPGVPGIVIGRNSQLAWGVTYSMMDCVDSWVEHCQEGKFRRADAWLPFTVRKELIRRKRRSPVEITFYHNEHGVLEGDPSVPGYYLSTRWSCNEGTAADSIDAMLRLLEASSVEAGRQFLGRINNSAWCWVLADRTGSIGAQMSGKCPLRPQGYSGLVPLPGWDPANDWQGFAPPEDLPRAFNPPAGYLITANNDLNALGRVRAINLPVAAYRAERIHDVLSQNRRFTLPEMRKLQLDLYSLQAECFLQLLRPLLPHFEQSHPEAVRILKNWDLRYTPDSPGAALFERVYHALLEGVFGHDQKPGFGSRGIAHLWEDTGVFVGFFGNFDRVMLAEHSAWFGGQSRQDIYLRALQTAFQGPITPYGKNRQVKLLHLLFGGKLPRMLGFDRGPITLAGSRGTVNQGQLFRRGSRPSTFAPAFRMVTDLATDAIHSSLPGGPSDRRSSPWYDNGWPDWLAGNYRLRASSEP